MKKGTIADTENQHKETRRTLNLFLQSTRVTDGWRTQALVRGPRGDLFRLLLSLVLCLLGLCRTKDPTRLHQILRLTQQVSPKPCHTPAGVPQTQSHPSRCPPNPVTPQQVSPKPCHTPAGANPVTPQLVSPKPCHTPAGVPQTQSHPSWCLLNPVPCQQVSHKPSHTPAGVPQTLSHPNRCLPNPVPLQQVSPKPCHTPAGVS